MPEPHAFVRGVPASFDRAVVQGQRPTIDVDLARRQHAAYVAVLRRAGYRIEMLAPDDEQPDCPFIEDAAVIIGDTAVITRPGAPSRRGEVEPVAAAIGRHLPIERIAAPGTLDGGDVLQVGDVVYVGRSERTNDAGIEQLRRLAAPHGRTTVAVDVSGVLHLKSAVSLVGNDTLVVAPGCVDRSVFGDHRIVDKAAGEAHAASTLHLGRGALLMTTGAPGTAERLTHAGFEITLIDMSEFQAADGGLTCLSVLMPPDR